MFRSSRLGRFWLALGAASVAPLALLALLAAPGAAAPADQRVTSHRTHDFRSVVNVDGEGYLFTGVLQSTATIYERDGERMADLHMNFARASVLEQSSGQRWRLTGSEQWYRLRPSEDGAEIKALEFVVLMAAAKSAQEDLKAIMAKVKAISNVMTDPDTWKLEEVEILFQACPDRPCA